MVKPTYSQPLRLYLLPTLVLANLVFATFEAARAQAPPTLGNGATSTDVIGQGPQNFNRAPDQVTEVTAAAGNSRQLAVSWTAVTGTVTGYKVQWKSGQQDYDTSDRQKRVTSGTTATMTGLTNGVTYTVRVKAYNSAGDGQPSAEVTGTPVAEPALSSSSVEDDTATLTIADHAAAWYYKYTVPTGGTCSAAIAAGTTTADLTNLSSNTNYTFKAYSNNGCTTQLTSATTDTDFLTKPGKPSKPVAVTGIGGDKPAVTSSVTGGGTLTSWKYQYREKNDILNTYMNWNNETTPPNTTTTSLSFTKTELRPGQILQFRVKAVNATGESEYSEPSDEATPAEPVLTVREKGDDTATLSLANWTGAWYYQRQVPTPKGECSAQVAAGTTTVSLSNLSSAT